MGRPHTRRAPSPRPVRPERSHDGYATALPLPLSSRFPPSLTHFMSRQWRGLPAGPAASNPQSRYVGRAGTESSSIIARKAVRALVFAHYPTTLRCLTGFSHVEPQGLVVFESISPGYNEGITMYRTKTKAVRRVAVATTLGLGLVGGIAGIAAADGNSNVSSHVATVPSNEIFGTVLGYVAGTSISVLTKGATAPTSYALSATTTISGLATGVTAPAVGDHVKLMLSSTTPVTVTSITIHAPRISGEPMKIEGTVLAYVAGTSISVSTQGSTTPTLYALNAATTITGLGTGVTAPAVNDNVDLVLSTATPAVVVTIKDEGVTKAPVAPTATRIEGTVAAYVAGTSISVLTKGGTTPTLYTLNAATTIVGLATGVTAPVVGDNVDLVLSTTTPVVVVTIKDEANQKCDGNGDGNRGGNHWGDNRGGANQGFGRGHSNHD